LRREAAHPTVPLVEAARAPEARPAAEPEIGAMIARLPEKYRQVLLLFYFEEKSYEEVASMLNLPMGTVKTHLHRARKELAAALQSGGAEVSHGLRGV
jgi:RNA polymerase sigma-70 factor (ECF subfamily)